MLRIENPVFDAWGATRSAWRVRTDPSFLPVIPLVGAADKEVDCPDWPRGKLDSSRLESIKCMVERRFAKLLCFEATRATSKFVACLGALGKARIGQAATEGIEEALRAAKL